MGNQNKQWEVSCSSQNPPRLSDLALSSHAVKRLNIKRDSYCCSPPWMRRLLPSSVESVWASPTDEENQSPGGFVMENELGRVLLSPLECDEFISLERSDFDTNMPDALTNWSIGKNTSEPFPNEAFAIKSFADDRQPSSPTSITISTQEESDDSDSDDNISRDPSDDIVDNYDLAELAPESIEDLLHCPRILTDAMIHQLHYFLPEGLKMNPWDRCFAIGRDGDSFVKLLDSCSAYTYSILVIRTVQGHVLGGFASQPWQAQDGFTKRGAYYGTGQSFLFGSCPEERIAGLDAEPHSTRTTLDAPLQIFSWTGSNDYCQICDTSRQVVCMGGGGDFGWIIRDNFARGQTGRCRTYCNPPLVPGGLFEIADVEVYGLQSIFDSSLISSSRTM